METVIFGSVPFENWRKLSTPKESREAMGNPENGQFTERSFQIVRRGYSKSHVDTYIRELHLEISIFRENVDELKSKLSDAEETSNELRRGLRHVEGDRDGIVEKLNDRSVALGVANNQIDQLTHELNRISATPISNTGLSERMDRMLTLASEEADQIRESARLESEEMLELSFAQAEKLTAEAEALKSTAVARQAQTESEYASILHDARAEASKLTSDAASLRDAADIESAARRAELEQANVNEMNSKRVASEALINSSLEKARSEADRMLRNARSEANQIVLSARQEADLISAESEIQQQMAEQAKGVIIRQLSDIRDRLDNIPDMLFHSHQYTSSEVVRPELNHLSS